MAKTIMLRPTYDSSIRCPKHTDYYCSKRRSNSLTSSDTSLTTFSEQTTQRHTYHSPSRKIRSKTASHPCHSHNHTHGTDSHSAELKRVKQYVRDLQIEISTLRQNQLVSRQPVCEECQRHRRKHATSKHQLGQLKQQNSELSVALEEANKFISELQDENAALTHATKTLKKKAEKLLHLAQKRDALREENRQLSTAPGCKHRRYKTALEHGKLTNKVRKEQDDDIVKKKWERFRHEVAHLKGQPDYEPDERQRDESQRSEKRQQRQGDYYGQNPNKITPAGGGLQHPRTAEALQMMQQQDAAHRVKAGYQRCCNNHDGCAHYPVDRQPSFVPVASRPHPTVAPRKKVMSATELDKWTRFYAKKQAGEQKRQDRTSAYLASYKRQPERTMSAGERLERFRHQPGPPVNSNEYPGPEEYSDGPNPRNVSLAGTEDSKGHGQRAESAPSEGSEERFVEGHSEGPEGYEGKEVDLECVEEPLREIICQIDALNNA